MKDQNNLFGNVSRRKFLGSAAVAAAAVTVMPLASSCAPTPPPPSAVKGVRPNSTFNGVKIGAITYSFRSLDPGILNVLQACKDAGCSNIELMSNGIEDYLGAPKAPVHASQQQPAPAAAPVAAPAAAPAPAPAPAAAAAPGAAPAAAAPAPAGGGRVRVPLTPEEQVVQDQYIADLKAWRMSVPMTGFADLAKQFNDEGVDIHIVKWSPTTWTPEEQDYAFRSAKAMGAGAVCGEWPTDIELIKKLAAVAESNGMIAVFHNHQQFATPNWEQDVLIPGLAVSPAVMMNFDIGHFAGSTGRHPNEIIDQYKDRIFSLHLKDKTGPNTTPPNTNQVWGQGETPLEEVLLKLRDEKLPFFCDIELEYPIAPWSNSVAEVLTCVNFARQILI